MYIQNIASIMKRWQSMDSEALSLKTITNDSGLLKKEVIIQWNVWKEKPCCCLQPN